MSVKLDYLTHLHINVNFNIIVDIVDFYTYILAFYTLHFFTEAFFLFSYFVWKYCAKVFFYSSYL